MKNLYVILAFHAHEPLWDLPRRLIRGASDRRVADAVLPESYIRRRFKEGRNVYRDLIALASALEAPVALDITNELLYQIRRYGPGTLRDMAGACRSRLIAPIYTCAHHTHPTLLSSEELVDEIRLNQELVHDLLDAPRPRRKGLFFTECSVDARHLPAVEAAGINYVLCPELDPARLTFRATPEEADVHFRPFRLGERLYALPRCFDISQEIWRPLTLRDPDRVKYQGFLVGEVPVFTDEYQGGPLAVPRPGAAAAADEYAAVLRRVIERAPDGGLLLYLQDLELMDFGEVALATLREAWRTIVAEGQARLRFVSPEEYLDALDVEARDLPHVELSQVSWAPELRPALRADGHYPPRRAGVYRGYDADAIYRSWPFVFWEAGRFPTGLLDWLLAAFDFPTLVEASAQTLVEEDYQVDRFPPHVRLPLLLRLAKRACNYGWYPEEGMNKRSFLDGLLIADSLALELKLRRQLPRSPATGPRLAPWVLPGLARLPELMIDTRLEYLRFGLERWREEKGADPGPALLELEHARAERRRAREELLAVADVYSVLEESGGAADREQWRELLLRVSEHCKAVFLSLDHLQRAWGKADADFLIVPMYRFLYDIYPPLLPSVLAELEERWGFEPTTERLVPRLSVEAPSSLHV